ncbi:MAG TPA: glycosyl transferase [Nitrosospira sp.]
MSQIHVFTSAAFNYIPKVRMLFQSIREHHPEWKLHLALADELRPEIDLSAEPFDDVMSISTLDIPSWRGWAFCHTIVELATAIKPFALAKLLKRPDASKVIYLDPDIVVFSRLDDILASLDQANLVLTPHQICPEQSLAAVVDNEICSLKHGIYNLGFIGVATTEIGHEFANWWSQRVYHFCRADIPNGLFTDQRWIDLVPAFFEDVAIMRSARHNVATWNLTTRTLARSNGKYTVDGEPLGFYHFTGFDSGSHRIMALKNANGNSAVQELINWYSSRTIALAHDPLAKTPWAFSIFSDGSPITVAQRLVYRERLDLQRTFIDPFDASGYLAWWNKQGPHEYPQLFDTKTQTAELAKITSTLTPGFRPSSDNVDWMFVRSLLKQAITQPQMRARFAKRGWEVLRNEGIGGIKRRLIS